MSYGSHYGGGRNGRTTHETGRDRDTDSNRADRSERKDKDRNDRVDRNERNDRSSTGRLENSRKRTLQQSISGDQSSSAELRRPNTGRDFHGYRSGLNRTIPTERPQNYSSGPQSAFKRRDRNLSHEASRGSKYRPDSNTPRGPSQGLSHKSEGASSRGSAGNRADRRHNIGLDETAHRDRFSDKRPPSRKQDWDSSMNLKARQLDTRSVNTSAKQNKAESRSSGYLKEHPRINGEIDAAIFSNKDLSKEFDSNGTQQKPSSKVHSDNHSQNLESSQRPSFPSSKRTSVGGTPSAVSDRESEAKGSCAFQNKRSARELPLASSPYSHRSQNMSNSSDAEDRNKRLQRLFEDDADEADDAGTSDTRPQEESTEHPKEKPGTGIGMHDQPRSPSSNGFDTSVLSPVGSTASDDALVQKLNIVPEVHLAISKKETSDPEDYSEAETVVNEDSLDFSKSRSYLRKNGRDAFRDRAKRRSIVYSEEDEFQSEDDAPPHKLGVKAQEGHMQLSDKHDYSNELTNILGLEESGLSAKDDMKMKDMPAKSSNEKRLADNQSKQDSKRIYKIKRDSTGRSQLQRACKKGDLREVESLIARGASANERDFGGFTCLHEAALAGHTDIVELLIANGADVNQQALEAGGFETPLMDAAENKHISTVKCLLKYGADPYLCNDDGYSTVTKLIRLQEDDEEFENVLKIINELSPPQINSELSKVTHSTREIIHDPSERYFNDLLRNKSHSLIYKYAAQGNKESAAEDFVTHALSLSKMPDVLNLAARNGHVELVDIFLGLNPGAFDINHTNKIGITALLASVGRGFHDVVKFLLSKGADPCLRRAQDGLNALEIAKHSAVYDPREVVLLEEFINNKELNATKEGVSTRAPAEKCNSRITSNQPQDINTTEPQSEKQNCLSRVGGHQAQESAVTKLRLDHHPDDEKRSNRDAISYQDTQAKLSALGDPDISDNSKRRMSSDGTTTHEELKESSDVSPDDESCKSALQRNHDKNSLAINSQGEESAERQLHHRSSSPGENAKGDMISPTAPSKLSLKAQEEQKTRAVEQAKVWQEKVQAKKRARKEMFLLAEKEKEKKRQEDELHKLELLQIQEAKEKEQKRLEQMEAKTIAEKLEKKKRVMERQFMLQNYPIGLQEAIFNGTLEKTDRIKYTPLYVFNIDNERWVIDMQVALVLATSVKRVHSFSSATSSPQIDEAMKDKLWSIFSKMIGVGKNNVIEASGVDKFRCLQLEFVNLSEITNWVKAHQPEVFEELWTKNRLTTVDLDSLEPARRSDTKSGLSRSQRGVDMGFIPPKLRQRGDVLKTIQTAHSPLW